MKGKNVGLYFGINSIGVAVAQAKNIISLANFELSSLEEGKAEAVKEEVRWEALINKALREVGADTETVYVSLADRDFIFRPLEMPLMKKSEIESSLIYEIEKYIPFKLDELEWDYDFVRFPKEKKVAISFVGIRENNFQRVRSILARLNIKAVVIEPSCLSLARILKSSKDFAQCSNFALLDFTKSESYLTFFQNNLPAFNRYLTIPKKGEALDLDKFVESVNLSFQYFKREFKTYEIDKFIVAGSAESGNLISSLKENLQTDVEIVTVSPYDLTANGTASMESTKALGVASRDSYPGTFRPILRKTEVTVAEAIGAPMEGPGLRIGLLSALFGAGLIASLAIFMMGEGEVTDMKNKLKKFEEEIYIPKELKEMSWKQREASVKTKASEVRTLRNLSTSFKKALGFFDTLRAKGVLPEGLWLDTLTVSQKANQYTGDLSGYIFRDDDYKERLGLDEFISNLKQEEAVKSIFSSIDLSASRRSRIRDFDVTSFTIKLR